MEHSKVKLIDVSPYVKEGDEQPDPLFKVVALNVPDILPAVRN